MIEIKNLTKVFDDVIAIKHLNLKLSPGIIGLVGRNGAGKSTLFRLIADVYIPDEGKIILDGVNNYLNEAKKKIFFLSDTPYYVPRSTVKDVYYLYNSAFNIDENKFYEILNDFNLPLNRRIDGFSKGMLRQLFIALALSSDAKIILLDEAFDGLDPLIIARLSQLLISLKDEERTIVVSSHNITSLQSLVDEFVILHKGELSSQGEEEVLSQSFVKYQMLCDDSITLDSLRNDGLNVISVNKLGSIYHLVFVKDDTLKDRLVSLYHPSLLEEVAMDAQELISAEMSRASRKENE